MIFLGERFQSRFDFEQIVEGENIKTLSEEIVNQITKLSDVIYNGNKIELAHPDNNGNKIYVSKISEDLICRNKTDVAQQLYRKSGNKTTISKYLLAWGIEMPEEGTKEYCDYLKLLYCFYMIRYVVFEDDNFFNFLNMDKLSTDFSPIKNATMGKYATFIMNVLLDCFEANEYLSCEDKGITLQIYNISSIVDKLISHHNPESVRYIEIIEKLLDGIYVRHAREESIGVINKTIDYFYRYQNMAYAKELLHTLENNDSVFCFDEIEQEHNKNWEHRYINVDNCMSFLLEKETEAYYMQAHTNRPKGLECFVDNIIAYDKIRLENYESAEWLEYDTNGDIVILAVKLAVIAKTFMDLGTSKFDVYIKNSKKKREHEKSFRTALTGQVSDIAMRYFVIAYRSEFMNARLGHGYYPALFKPLYIRKYALLQKIMLKAFSIANPEERAVFLLDVINQITITITMNQEQ